MSEGRLINKVITLLVAANKAAHEAQVTAAAQAAVPVNAEER